MRRGGGRRRLPRLLAAAACVGLAAACDAFEPPPIESKVVQGGDPARGRAIMASGAHGCTACHAIPGIRAARGVVGPPLHGLARRGFIAGRLPNTPGVLVAFLMDPPALAPETGMPDVGLTAEESRHVAAFLYTLERLPDAR